jgi:MFS family permease
VRLGSGSWAGVSGPALRRSARQRAERRRGIDLLSTRARRRWLFALLYFSEGAPMGFLWIALPALLKQDGVGVARITALTSTLALPWAIKWLLAPLVDVARGAGVSLRSWIGGAQLVMAASLVPLAVLGPAESLSLLLPLLLVHATAAALQAVGIAALCIAVTEEHERGSVNGWMQAGMRAGMALFGGGALVVATTAGPRAVVLALIALQGVVLLLLAGVPARAGAVDAARGAARDATGGAQGVAARMLSTLRDVFGRRSTWLGLLFALVAGAGFEAVGGLESVFLLERGLSTDTVGWFASVPKTLCLVGGALLGGRLADRWGRRRSLLRFQALCAAAVLLVAGLDARGVPAAPGLLIALGALWFTTGLFLSASYALLMDLTDARIAATQFSAFMGATNACEAWSVRVAGQWAPTQGYPFAFAMLALVSLVALPLVILLRRAPAARDQRPPTGSDVP